MVLEFSREASPTRRARACGRPPVRARLVGLASRLLWLRFVKSLRSFSALGRTASGGGWSASSRPACRALISLHPPPILGFREDGGRSMPFALSRHSIRATFGSVFPGGLEDRRSQRSAHASMRAHPGFRRLGHPMLGTLDGVLIRPGTKRTLLNSGSSCERPTARSVASTRAEAHRLHASTRPTRTSVPPLPSMPDTVTLRT